MVYINHESHIYKYTAIKNTLMLSTSFIVKKTPIPVHLLNKDNSCVKHDLSTEQVCQHSLRYFNSAREWNA